MKAMYLLPFILSASLAFAGGTHDPRTAQSVSSSAKATAVSGAVSSATAHAGEATSLSTGGSVSGVSAEGGNASATGGSIGENANQASNSVRTENNSSFFAFGTTFPNSQGCFAGAQGGGGGNGGAGFLGFHYLDHNCWTSQLASQTRNVEVKARLNCAGGKFRNAIAFDQPKGQLTRQRYCVEYMVSTYNAEIEEMKAHVDEALASGLLQIREDLVTERDALCDARIERCEAEVLK